MASLYLYNPGEFWATVDKVDHHFQPLGANMLWPDFQVRGIFYILQKDFLCLQFFQKNERKNEKNRHNSTMIPQVELFSFEFLEELRIPKSPFEIN